MYLFVKVVPRSKLSEFAETLSDGTLKIRLKAAPEKGRANQELLQFLSESLHIPKSKIQIISGLTDTHKLLKLPDTTLPW